MKPKNIFLAYGYSAKNAGDLAICVGAIDLLIEQGYKVSLLSKYDRNDEEFFTSKDYYTERYKDKIKILEAPFTLNRNAGFFKQVWYNFKGLLIYLGFQNSLTKQIRDEVIKSDLVIFNGGNLLRCSGIIDYIRLIALNYPVKLSIKNNKDYIIFPHSTAEINWMGKGIIGKMVRRAKAVFAREPQSYEKLKKDFKLTNIYQSLDLAFFTAFQETNQRETEETGIKSIGFTFRALTVGDIKEFTESEKQRIYIQTLKIMRELGTKHNYIFCIQSLGDKAFTENLRKKIQSDLNIKIQIFENYNPIELIRRYQGLDLLIGMRLHSLILAAAGGTPGYGLFYKEWGLKNPGMMDLLSLDYKFMDEGKDINYENLKRILNNKDEFQKKVLKIKKDYKDKLVESLTDTV